ncbi:MAG: DUF4147 domain-containing protein [Anaerolineae bacterium]|nr:DUF4147 domain-containing protein [Anaerolineae bacterium]
MRILNAAALTSHGNIPGRKALVDILEAGLQAADPYTNARKLLRVEGNRLFVGYPDFEPHGAPKTGEEVFDLSQVGRIYVVGAGKGVQQVAKAIEEALGDRLTGGHVIAKHGDPLVLKRIGVTFGGHPVPDEGCVRGCQQILALCRDLRPEDLVFTIAANGVSALLTLPVPGVTLDEVRQVTYMMQIERGVPTQELNPVRNHLDVMKGGRISRYIQPATAIHIVAVDPNYAPHEHMSGYEQFMVRNRWLHTLPDCTTFAEAIAMLTKWDAWEAVPASVRAYLLRADLADETVKAAEFQGWRYRIFGIMPAHLGVLPTAQRKAAELGFTPHLMARFLQAEASQAGRVMADIAQTIEREGTPFAPPCALISGGELLVTVGSETGVGGRNQEYAVAAALRIVGSANIVMGGVDTDGTDGPGGRFAEDENGIPCLAGGVVDGETAAEARAAGIDLAAELKRHNTSPALWKLNSGVAATQNISLTDLDVTLILGRAEDQALLAIPVNGI